MLMVEDDDDVADLPVAFVRGAARQLGCSLVLTSPGGGEQSM